MFKLQPGLNTCTNAEYHSDKSYLSSSSLKKLLESPAKFFEELQPKEEKEKENPAFVEGSLTHSLILEPKEITEQYAFFDGDRKQGPAYEEFKTANNGKVIISKPQKSRCLAYKRAFDALPTAVKICTNGHPEFTLCVDLLGVPIKVRADYINIKESFIVDVKTSAYSVEVDQFKLTVSQFKYDLSAALYAWAFELYYNKPFKFYFAAISKSELDCQVYFLSPESELKARSQIIKALTLYKQCLASGVWPETPPPKSKERGDYQILEV